MKRKENQGANAERQSLNFVKMLLNYTSYIKTQMMQM